MVKFLYQFIFRNLILGFLIGNLVLPFSDNLLYSQTLLSGEKSIFKEEIPPKRDLSEIEQSIERSRFIRYKQERWNEMRRRLESGEPLIPEIEKPVPTADRKTMPQQPPPIGPGINVLLPYESGLSISGRKLIDFRFTTTIYDQPDSVKGRINKTDFELNQQLQVRVKGTVGRKVTVNVDFDDTREDKRDISVQYKGDPDEILQEAAFGDITISLPGTEFVSYSKSVFGARAELLFRPRTGFARLFPSMLWHRYTPKQIKFFLIGSRTKGITQTKRFTGQSTLQRKELLDIGFSERKFYRLAFSTGPFPAEDDRAIQTGSERIFIDDQNPNNNNVDETTRTFKVLESALTAVGGVVPSTSTFAGVAGLNTGVFKRMIPGVDYTIDYVRGVIRFLKTIQLKDIIVVDYIPNGTNRKPLSQEKGELDPLIPQPDKDTFMKGYKPLLLKPDETQFFATRELKNYYDLGDKRIVRDDGRGNFILRIIDKNSNEPPDAIRGLDVSSQTQIKVLPKYPENIDVDFESGVFSFINPDTFRSPNPHPFTDDIYRFRERREIPADKNRYKIFAEYRFRKGNFSLDQINIVSLSEQIFIDGRKMTRDVDYFIDYDIGIVTFFRPEFIRDDSVVEITYDYSPFGGQGEETLVGMRSEWYVTDNFFLGNSVLLNFAPRTRGLPDLRSTSRSITVLEADMTWKNIKFGKGKWFPLQITNLAAEVAQSIKNPNTADKAIIESFEGIKLDDAANLNRDFWQVASNPQRGNSSIVLQSTPLITGPYKSGFSDAITLTNEGETRITDIIPNAPIEASDRIPVLKMDYNLAKTSTVNEAASIVHVLSRTGVDFHTNRRQFLEVWMHGDGSNAKVQFRLGGIDENSDGSGALKTEDKDRNGTLSPGEDIGWQFINPDGSTTTIGAGNARLDTNDLDGNGRLNDGDDLAGNYSDEATVPVNFQGWQPIQIPLNIPTTAQTEWSAIKQVRVTIVNPGNAPKGTIKFGRIAVVGTRFKEAEIEPSTTTLTAQVFAENNQENRDYQSLLPDAYFQELYEIQDSNPKRREQALAIKYDRTNTFFTQSTVTTKLAFTRGLDFSEHKNFKFYLFGDNSGNDFFIRIGGPGNFFEHKTPLSFSGWRLIELDIRDKNRDGQLDDKKHNVPGQPDAWQRRSGAPSLRNISQIEMGVVLKPGGPQSGKIYVNEIHLTESVKITGLAYRANSDFTWPGWATWGGRWRFMDRNFQTLTSVGSGTDSKTGSAYFNLSRMKFLPVNTNMSYTETVTPQIQTINDPNILVPSIDEGKSISTNQTLSGNFLMTQLPWIPGVVKNKLFNVDFSADHSLAFRSAADQEDETINYRYGSSYSFPWQPDILPTRFLTFKPFPTSLSYSFSQNNSFQRKIKDNTNTRSASESYSFRPGFAFFPRLGLSPSYSLSRSFEERSALDAEKDTAPNISNSFGRYHKSLSQAASLSGSFRLISWLTPSFNYSINTSENYNVTEVKFGTATFNRGSLKSITRSSSGDLSASFSPKDVFQYIRYVRVINKMINSLSFSGGYTVSDGDTYENMDPTFESRDKLFIRGVTLDLSNQNPNARRTSLTATDSSRLSGRWTPFEGFTFLKSRRWSPLKNINGSGTFSETLTRRDATGTQSFSYSRVWPDFIVSTYEIEQPLFLTRWMSDTRLNGNYQERLSEVRGQTRSKGLNQSSDFTFTLFKLLQFSVGYRDSSSQDENLQTNQVTSKTKSRGINGQVITTLKWGNWRFTPRYDQDQSESEDGTGKKTSDVVNRNGSLQIFGDINVPRFFRLPFGKQLTLTNRLIITSSFRYALTRDGVDATRSRDTVDSNLNGDLEVTPNIRVGFGGSFTRTMNKVKKEDDFSTFGFNTRITIQF